MKKCLHFSISIFLSAIILLSGSGLIIGKMVCLKSGKEIISAKEAEDCCGDEAHQTSFKGECCALSNLTFHQHTFVPENYFNFKTFSPTIVSFLSTNSISLFKFIAENETPFIPDPPLDRSPSTFLPLLGIFRI